MTASQGARRRSFFGRALRALFLLLFVAAAAAIGYEMTKERPPEHADPAAVTPPSTPNWALAVPETADVDGDPIRTPVFDETPLALIERLEAIALAEPKTERIDGGGDTVWRSYRQRSRLLGFPDLISVRAAPAEGGATLYVFSRAVYGYSDMGVNRKRVERWLGALEAAE